MVRKDGMKITNVSKIYETGKKNVEAVKSIDADIRKGEFVAFVGPSGCGKTTLLKCIAGLLEPTKGEITLDGKKIEKPDRSIGVVFQDLSLFPWLTAKENIEFGLRMRSIPEVERKRITEYYLRITGLKEFSGYYPRSLSGGMKQRVAIARTLANSPEIILMDEPFGSLDSLTRSKMQEFLTCLWEKERKTIVFVTHDIEEAIFLSDRVLVLSKRPAGIIKEIKVPFRRPRLHGLKHTTEFFGLKNRIAGLLGY